MSVCLLACSRTLPPAPQPLPPWPRLPRLPLSDRGRASRPTLLPSISLTPSARRPWPRCCPLETAPLWNLRASEEAGGLWSSLEDMARWVEFQLTGPCGDGERGASLPLRCQRGGTRDLELAIDAEGKPTRILGHEPEGLQGGCE